METSIHDMSIVPEIGDFDFDLTTMDTFDDLDISMENFDIVESASDPFGDFSLEQSLNLVELNNVKDLLIDDIYSSGDSDSSSILDDFDIKETIKQDCMWSSAHDVNSKSLNIKHKSRSLLDSKLSLTPPTSYINQHLQIFDTPIPSDDDSSSNDGSSDEIDVVSGYSETLLKNSCESISSGDHSYTSGQGKSSSLLTPPESSEDEDSSQGIYISKAAQDILKARKTGLKEIENDRFNKVVKSILLKSSSKSLSTTSIDKAKFKFSISMNSNSKTSLLRRKSKLDKKSSRTIISSSYQGVKENKQTLKFSHGFQNKETNRVTHLDRVNKDKTNHKEARDVHNQMERQRRTDLKNAFDQLKDYVPTIANSDRASKQMVLDKAIEHCKTLKMKENSVREQRKNIVQRNELLKKKLALLESQIASCQVENADWEIQW